MKTGKRETAMVKWEKPRILAVEVLRPALGHCIGGHTPTSTTCSNGAQTGNDDHYCYAGGVAANSIEGAILRNMTHSR